MEAPLPTVSHAENPKPGDRADVVLSYLRASGRLTTRQIADATGWSRSFVGKIVASLVADGRVRPMMSGSRSPFQSYEAVE